MADNSQSRKWNMTLNNPDKFNINHESIKEIFKNFKSLIYWCMSDEIGEQGTPHIHFYMAFSSAMRFSTIKKHFGSCHIEMANGTSQQNRDYVFKEGKWEKDKKKETNLSETHEEFGDLPVERQGKRNDIDDLYDMIKSGMTDFDIMDSNPAYMLMLDKIERARQIIKENEFKSTFRKLDVTYICGKTATGKTRGVMEKYGYENVFRITDYSHPFDKYKNQDVIIFEEFRSSLKIQEMLNYLDGYPLELPARYSNKIACFTKVYILTNIDLSQQYEDIQLKYSTTWKAFLRRIQHVNIHELDNTISNYELEDLNGLLPCMDLSIKNKKVVCSTTNSPLLKQVDFLAK